MAVHLRFDHKRNNFTVWESGAILEYLADAYDTEHKFSGATPEEKASISHPVQGNLYFSKVYWDDTYDENGPPNYIKRFKMELDRVFKVDETQLKAQAAKYSEDKAWLVLDRPTIADFSPMGWLARLPALKEPPEIDTNQCRVPMKYVEKLCSQEGMGKVQAKMQQS